MGLQIVLAAFTTPSNIKDYDHASSHAGWRSGVDGFDFVAWASLMPDKVVADC